MLWRRRTSGRKSALPGQSPEDSSTHRPRIEHLEGRILLSASAYTWQNVNIGAGGFVDGVFFSPTQQNVIYARTDIGGLYKSTNDGANWSELLDFVGNGTGTSGNGTQSQEIGVLSFAIDPENPNNLYADVGQYSGSNGDVIYSTDAGQTWTQTALSFYVGGNSDGRGDGEQIAVDPNDSNIVFLGSNNAGLWESANAGHSFTRISTSLFSPTSTTFVLFDPSSGTPGNPSQTIYVGIDSTSAGTNLYKTTTGGTSWAQVTGTGSLPTGYLPGHAVLSGGNLYLGYGNVVAPGDFMTNGGVYRYTPGTGAWDNISPLATDGSFGYNGVAADPENPNWVVVTSFDYYSGPDMMWRTTDAEDPSPNWYSVLSTLTAQNYGYNGYNQTRNAASAPYTYDSNDGIINWPAAIAINPYNSNQLMYGTGEGIWATNNLTNNGNNSTLMAPNSWYFPDDGIEFTEVNGVAAGSAGMPLFSAMGDIFGFAHTTLTSSPAQGAANEFASANGVDAADNVVAIVGSPSGGGYGVYSTDDGLTFQTFATSPGTGDDYGTDTVAVSANGSAIVWAQSGQAPYYTTNDGGLWTPSGGGMAANGQIIADRLVAGDFYYYVGTDIYFSNNGGVSFTRETTSAPSGGDMAANPFATGDLWIAAAGGLYHSANFGATIAEVSSSLASTNGVVALGAPAPGQTVPAIYVFGTISNFLGVYRSDDGGSTWTQLNDVSHQWGGLLNSFAADPNVFGRLYIAVNGRGIIMGNPASSLPANWVDTDINNPGNPGWSTSSITLSNGTMSNRWILNGGGAGLTGETLSVSSITDTVLPTGPFYATAVTAAANGLHVGDTVTISGAAQSGYDGTFDVASVINATTFTYYAPAGLPAATGTITASTNDQFNFAYKPVTGNTAVSAELLGLSNADEGNGTPVAGVMIRAGANDNDPFAAMVQTAAGNLEFEYRATAGGAVTTAALGGVPVGSEYVEIIDNAHNFSGYYSSDGIHWTQLGATVSISAMPAMANAGLAASANFNSQLTCAAFGNVIIGAPAVTGFVVNDGNAQRAMVESLTVTFSQAVTLGTGAITLNQFPMPGGAPVAQDFVLSNPSGNQQTYVLTFTDSGDVGGSLPDGIYELVVHAALVNNSTGSSLAGGDQSFGFYRLFGDFTGAGDVSSGSLLAIIQNFNRTVGNAGYVAYEDIDSTGQIGSASLLGIIQRFNHNFNPLIEPNPITGATIGEPLTITATPAAPSSDDILSYQWTVLDANGNAFSLPNDGVTTTPSLTFTPGIASNWSVSVEVIDLTTTLSAATGAQMFAVAAGGQSDDSPAVGLRVMVISSARAGESGGVISYEPATASWLDSSIDPLEEELTGW